MTATTRHLMTAARARHITGDALMLAGLVALVVAVPLAGLAAGPHAAVTAGAVSLALMVAGGVMQR